MLGRENIHSIAYACHQSQYNLTIGSIPPAWTNDIFYVGLLKLCKGLLFNRDFKQTEKSLRAHAFCPPSASRRKPDVTPHVSGTQIPS